MSKQVKEHGSSFGYFSICKKTQLPAVRISDEVLLLTKSKSNRSGYKFSKYLRKKRAVKSRTRSRPRIQRSPIKVKLGRLQFMQAGGQSDNLMLLGLKEGGE